MFQGQISKKPYLRNCWSDWREMKRKRINRILGWLYDLDLWPHPWPWPWSFKVRVGKSLISGMGMPTDMEQKGCESSIDHGILTSATIWGGRMYRIVAGVTSDVGVPSTYLVRPLGTNFNENVIKIYTFSFKKMHNKISSGKWCPYCLDLNVITPS